MVIGGYKPIYHPGMLYAVGPMLFGIGCLREALLGHRRPQPALVPVATSAARAERAQRDSPVRRWRPASAGLAVA